MPISVWFGTRWDAMCAAYEVYAEHVAFCAALWAAPITVVDNQVTVAVTKTENENG